MAIYPQYHTELESWKSSIPSSCKDANDVPENSSFAKYLSVLKREVKAGRLMKKVTKWFNSDQKNSFDYRFTGKETKKLFGFREWWWSTWNQNETLCNCKLCFRTEGEVSLFSRVNIDGEDLMALKGHCQTFFNVVSTLLQSVNPTVWTIGYVVPCHTEFLYKKYKVGLDTNSRQSREAKHVRLQ